MKNILTLVFSILALALSVFAFYNSQKQTPTVTKSHFSSKADEEVEIEIADLMLYIQHFHNKLYLSAKNDNQSLTTFYLNEMGEKMNEIVKANIWSNGVNISENMKIYGLKQIDAMLAQKPIEVFNSFDNLTQSCNSCHVASKHANIKIKTPVDAVYFNQDFSN
jgi:hypothetical protein